MPVSVIVLPPEAGPEVDDREMRVGARGDSGWTGMELTVLFTGMFLPESAAGSVR
jgi:hypothetical protein